MKNGFGPAPAPTVAWPINDPAPQLPAFAADAEHCSASLIRPSSPFGDSTVNDSNSSSLSSRSSATSNGVLPPATGLCTPASNAGLNLEAGQAAPLPSPLMSNELVLGTIRSVHETSSTDVLYVPHLRGDVSGARGPLLNGNCGSSSKMVVNWPVTGSSLIAPGNFRSIPSSSERTSTAIRNISPEAGS